MPSIFLYKKLNSSFIRGRWVLILLLLVAQQFHGQPIPSDHYRDVTASAHLFSANLKNTDSLLRKAQRDLQDALYKNDRIAEGQANDMFGLAYAYRGQLDSSIEYYQHAKTIFTHVDEPALAARTAIALANVYSRQYKIDAALQQLILADSISTVLKNLQLQADVQLNLGIVYKNNEDYSQSADRFKIARSNYQELDNYSGYISASCGLSMAYRSLRDYDSSLYVLQSSLALFSREKLTDRYLYATLEENIGDTYLDMDRYQEALPHFFTALAEFKKFNSTIDIAYEEYSIGRTYAEMKYFREAEPHLFEAYKMNDSLRNFKYLVWISNGLATMYNAEGNWKNAYRYLEIRNQWQDSINIAQQIANTNALKEKYETAKKEQEISLLKAQNLLSYAENRKNKLLQFILAILFTASIIIAFLITNRMKMKRKLEQQILRNQLASDLHDDIGSSLSSIDISSKIALQKRENVDLVESQLQKISDQARQSMESMSDIVWSIKPGEDRFDSILTRMREFAATICEASNCTLAFNVEPEINAIKLSPAKRKNLFLVFKEAVNNAIKYSHCKKIDIQFHTIGKTSLQLDITDDGTGFIPEQSNVGNGLKNMEMRAAEMQGTIQVRSMPGTGTIVQLTFPR